jgi:hypothetical protein
MKAHFFFRVVDTMKALIIAGGVVLMAVSGCSGSPNINDSERAIDTVSESPTSVDLEITQTLEVPPQSSIEQTAPSISEQPPTAAAPTSLPTPTLPASTEQEFSLGELLFSDTADCVLPCWNGIMPGQSTEKEVEAAILSVFEVDLSEEPQYDFEILPSTSEDLAQQYYSKSHAWYTGQSNSDSAFYLDVSFDKSNQVLELVQMKWSIGDSSRFKVSLSPLDVIRELGTPLYMAVHLQTSARTDYGCYSLLLVYPQGIVFQFFFIAVTFTTTPTDNPAIQDTHVEFCLSINETEPETNVGYIVGDVFLMQPFSADLTDLTPVQASVITDLIEFYEYEPLDAVFGVTLEAIAVQIAGGDDVCLSTTFND